MQGDRTTYAETLDYFLLRAGPLSVALQQSRSPSSSPYGLLLWRPERFVRKESTWLFHPESGLAGTMASIASDGERYSPTHDATTIYWEERSNPGSAIIIEWRAGPFHVRERFSAHPVGYGLRREIELLSSVKMSGRAEATLILPVTPNPLLFPGLPEQNAERENAFLMTEWGRENLALTIVGSTGSAATLTTFERFFQLTDTVSSEREMHLQVDYLTEGPPRVPESRQTYLPCAESGSFAREIEEMIARSVGGLDALVADDGRFDASVWQYGYEWGQDAAMIAEGLCYAGEIGRACDILANLLERLTDRDGRIAESSRFRGGDLAELNANGAVLSSLFLYYQTSGDIDLPRTFRTKIERIGSLLLEAIEEGPTSLIFGRRDLWERLPWMGVEEGADVATNAFAVRGLLDGAFLLAALGDQERAETWRRKARTLKEEMFPTSFIDDGRIIHRRLVDGEVSRRMTPGGAYDDKRYLPYLPRNVEATPRPSDPDSVAALPILLDLIAGDSPVAIDTVTELRRKLWDEREGGYLRSPLLSDPDSPGPWSFVTAWMAEAEIRTGRRAVARQTTEWLHERGGEAGTWMEYYGPRSSPPYPPIGIILWGWGEYLLLAMRGWYGVRITENEIHVSPAITPFRRELTLSGERFRIEARGVERARLNGEEITLVNGTATVGLPLAGPATLEFS